MLLRGTRPTNEWKVDCLGRKHLVGNVGKGPRQFHQGQAGFFLFGGFLLSHGRMTRGASTLLFLLLDQSTPFTCIIVRPMIGIGVRPLFFGGTSQFFPALQFSVVSLFGGFLVNEFQDVGFRNRWGAVTLPRLTGLGLYFVQPSYLFLRGVAFFTRIMPGLRGYPTVVLGGPPFPWRQYPASFRFKNVFILNKKSSNT